MKECDVINEKNIPLSLIIEISDVYEINNDARKLFCFTVTLQYNQIVNVFRKFSSKNRLKKCQEIRSIHSDLNKQFKRYFEENNNNGG